MEVSKKCIQSYKLRIRVEELDIFTATLYSPCCAVYDSSKTPAHKKLKSLRRSCGKISFKILCVDETGI